VANAVFGFVFPNGGLDVTQPNFVGGPLSKR
jgi:hypothetical protein